MANKDGVVSIGFDYKKELDEVCATIEKELNNLGGDINLSDGIKKQTTKIKKMIVDMKQDIDLSFDKISETKLDTKTFETFKKEVNKKIREVIKEVINLKEYLSALEGSTNINGIVQQIANLKKYIEDTNASVSELIRNSEKLGKSVVISPNLDTGELKNDVLEIKKLLTDLDKEDLDFGYSNKSAKELTNDLEGLVDKYYRITDLIDEMKSSMSGLDSTTQEYKNQEVQLSKLSLELLKCVAQIDDLFGAKNAEKINIDKIISIDELDNIFAYVKDKSSQIKSEAKNIVESIELSNTAVKNIGNNTTSDLSSKSNIEVHISTKQSTINKQLDEMIDILQQRAANKPIIAPVKLRVDSEYEKTTKDATATALTENQINEARKDVENVVPGLEKAFNNSMRIATHKAVENAKESIKSVREFFEKNPITIHLTVPDDEKLKIGKAILSEDGKTTIDLSGQVDKARKSVKGLSEDLEKSQLLIKENAQNAKNLSLEKLVNSLSETMSQFSELKGIITSIQNMENTIARASGIYSTNELVEQWRVVEKTIVNATKLDGDFRKNANIGKIVSEYQKYIDMGGTNALSDIDKIKDNESTINSILSKMKELKSQDVENDSIQKLSVDLDGVIAKFDELISTVKTATNALYKIIKQGGVSDLDKQWSSISDKFKSIADESGKINLSKQKTDIKELMDMYQKYENNGGINSLSSLTDNVETLRKLDKEYQKLNQAQSVDNSSTIEKESKTFKKIEKTVNSLTTAIGDTKVQAINIEATAMEDAAEREIIAIREILDSLDLIVSRLKDIKGIKLPKIEVKNVDAVEKAVESLDNVGNKSNISSENTTNQIVEKEKKKTGRQDNVQSSVNKALKDQVSAWKQIQSIREKIAKSNDSNEIALLQKSKKYYQEQYNNANKILKANTDLYNREEQILKLEQIRLSTNVKITNFKNKKTNKQEATNWKKNVQVIQDYMDAVTKLNNLKAQDKGTGTYANQIAVQEEKVKELKAKALEIRKIVDSDFDPHNDSMDSFRQWFEVIKQIEQASRGSTESVARLEDALRNMNNSKLGSMQSDLDGFKSRLEDFKIKPDDGHSFGSWKIKIQELNSEIQKYQSVLDTIKAKGGIVDKSDKAEIETIKNKIENMIRTMSKISAGERGWTGLGARKTAEKIYSILEKNTKMSKSARDQIQAYYDEIRNGNPSAPLNEILDKCIKIEQEERAMGRAGKSFLDIFKTKKLYSFVGQMASMFSFYDLINLGRRSFETIKDIDTALVDLKKTTAMNSSQLEEFYYDSNDVAKQMGVTTQAIIDQASAWSRLGYNTKESSTQMAELSSQFAAISPDMDLDTATDGLVSSMKAFDIEVSNVERDIMDNINRIGNTAATSNGEIVDMLTRSSAAMAAANNTIQETIALETAAVEITRNAETTGMKCAA